MAHVRSFKTLGLLAFLSVFSLVTVSQSLAQVSFSHKKMGSQPPAALGPDDPATLIQNKLLSQIKLTKATDDRTDIVTAGDIVALNKDGLMMCSSVSTYAFNNAYDNGVLTANPVGGANPNAAMQSAVGQAVTGAVLNHFFGSFGGMANSALNSAQAAPAKSPCTTRKFLAGEKFWVTGVTAQPDGILVSVFSDPYSDVRYYGEIKFFFPPSEAAPAAPVAHHRRGLPPPPPRVAPPVDDFLKTVAELIAVVPPDDQSNQSAAPETAAATAPAAPPVQLTDIAPPPPPPDVPPPTIALGQTKVQVVASFGQPVKAAKIGVKEIFYYKEMKVTFTSGKVSNVD